MKRLVPPLLVVAIFVLLASLTLTIIPKHISTILGLTNTQLQTKDDASLTAVPKGGIISNELLPPNVFEAQKKKMRIVGQFYIPNLPQYPPEIVGGTGFVVNYKSKIIILTARHVFLGLILDFNKRSLGFEYNKDGIPESSAYKYQFYGITDNDKHIAFPIVPIAMGEMGKFQDYIAFKPDIQIKLETVALANKNANEGIEVYTSGYSPGHSLFPDKLGNHIYVLSDIVGHTFNGKIMKKIEDMPMNKYGLKTFYRINSSVEQGFSGGPVFNKEGEVVGMAIESIRNFHYAISSDDLSDFLEKIYKKF